MKFKENVFSRVLSRLTMRGKKMRPEKAQFISENALFFKALKKEKQGFPKLNKNHEDT